MTRPNELTAARVVVSETDATARHRDWLTFAVVVVMLAAISTFLYLIVHQANATFGRGISVAEAAFKSRSEQPRVLIEAIYTLGLVSQVVTFKATALLIGALIAVLGGLFVLRTADASYNAELGGGNWKVTLGTTSPGLVMVSLGCILVAVAVLSKAEAPTGAGIAGASSSESVQAHDTSTTTDYAALADQLAAEEKQKNAAPKQGTGAQVQEEEKPQ